MPQGKGYTKQEENSLRDQMEKMRAAGVPRQEIAETISKPFRSVAAQKKALERLTVKYGGTHARNVQSRYKG